MIPENLYNEYAIVQKKIEALEEIKETMRRDILQALAAAGEEKVETPVGNFTVANKIKWVYSPAVLTLEEKLKIKKIQEQKKGVAKLEKSQYLLFSPIKP